MRLLLATALLAPTLAFGAGSSDAPPPSTKTSKDCYSEKQWDPEIKKYVKYSKKVNGVWDPKIRRCVRPDKASSFLDADDVYDAMRELAYVGRIDDAQTLLEGMDQSDDRVLTYWGFTHRKLGDLELANAFYEKAISQNPDNLLARSYMAQGFVAAGRTDDAIAQWREIMARGGEGSWPEASLREAIRSGLTYNY
ncbi:MAG: tetratricopeptide repeat protein [Marinibacterium sp.]|nr:tetratricopeptide repeat protein [Marinibacterium sp.]